MKSELQCECCSTNMLSDFSANVWCPNQDCLLADKSYSYDFIEGRRRAREAGKPIQRKERMAQGWANSPMNECKAQTYPEFDDTGMVIGATVEYKDENGNMARGEITKELIKHVELDGWRTIPKWYVKLVQL